MRGYKPLAYWIMFTHDILVISTLHKNGKYSHQSMTNLKPQVRNNSAGKLTWWVVLSIST